MDNKDIKKKNKHIKHRSNDIQNEKENVSENKVLLEKKKKKKSSINDDNKRIKNIGSIETDTSMNSINPNNTYILPPPVPKLKKQTKKIPQNSFNESSLPPSVPTNNVNKKLGYTTKIEVKNPIREADTVHLIDGSKEIIFKKYKFKNIKKDSNEKKSKIKPIQIKCPTTNESIIIQPEEIYNENNTEFSDLIYIHDPNKDSEEDTLIDIPPPNDLDVLYIEVGNKFRKVKGDNAENSFKMNDKDLPKVTDSHKILSYMKNADHIMNYFFLGVTLLFGGVCLLSLIIFPWSMPDTKCEKDTTSELYNFLVFYTPHASTIAFITNFMITFSVIGALDKFIISITTTKLPISEYLKSTSRKVILCFLAIVSVPCFISTTLIKYIDINISSSDRYYKLPSVTNTAIVPYDKITWEVSKKDLMPLQKWKTERLVKDIKWWIKLNLIRDISGVILCLLILIEMLMERAAKKKYRKLERNIFLSKILNNENKNNSKDSSDNKDPVISSKFNSHELNYNKSIDNFTLSDQSLNRIPLNQLK
ncbi:hypothetical protein BCR32DRAFT_290814 [Anaeromyces robustus]|uniref:Uncharacterized protein n=1 Tax=Anaeromyces robustus TaxID=1754192 RepID=A0A1Y1XHM7_9FUNG|nr:hypothetical protein BCR32DRAFT_290814 [Anaeromyces robustus]|eukprot:ORX85259.1 hypothetical protein BCR32DRAFT_290814 [Anaeromyces robustus]